MTGLFFKRLIISDPPTACPDEIIHLELPKQEVYQPVFRCGRAGPVGGSFAPAVGVLTSRRKSLKMCFNC